MNEMTQDSFFSKAWLKMQVATGWLPFSWGGSVFLLASLIALKWFGIERSDLVMVVLGAVGVALCILGFFLTLLAGLWMFFRLRKYEEETQISLVVGIPMETGFSQKIPWWFPLVQLKWDWDEEFFFVNQRGRTENVTGLRRGEWDKIRRQIYVGDAFGICQIRFPFVQELRLKVIPNTKDLFEPRIVQGLQAGADVEHPFGKPQGDRLDIRNYSQGDPMRYILWKVYARTGELVVRTPERAYQPTKKMLAYLIVSPEDQVAAGMALVALQGDLLGTEWHFGVDGSSATVSQRDLAMQAVIGSGFSEQIQAEGLSDFVRSAADESSSLLLFAPPKKGPWVDRVLELASRMPVSVMISAEGVSDAGILSAFKDVLFLAEDIQHPAIVAHDELSELVALFDGTGVQLSIVVQNSKTITTASQFRRSA